MMWSYRWFLRESFGDLLGNFRGSFRELFSLLKKSFENQKIIRLCESNCCKRLILILDRFGSKGPGRRFLGNKEVEDFETLPSRRWGSAKRMFSRKEDFEVNLDALE